MLKLSPDEYRERIEWSLDRKIQETHHRMEQWFSYWRGEGKEVSLSFSGGLDSTVMLHLLRANPFLKGQAIPVHFVDTGMEYPEIKDFVRSTSGVTVLKTSMPFAQVVRDYGWPVISKRNSQYIKEVKRAKTAQVVRLRLTGFKADGRWSQVSMISKKWQFMVGAPFKVSDHCCMVMKKKPLKCMSCPYVGVRATESNQRELTYQEVGCNAFDRKSPRSWPLAFWTESNIWEYIKQNSVKYSSIYDMGYVSTGCYPCMFGLHLEKWPNRYQLLQKTHPKLWNYCVDGLGAGKVIEWMNEHLPKKQKISIYHEDYECQMTTERGILF